jgi:hypothetical protein
MKVLPPILPVVIRTRRTKAVLQVTAPQETELRMTKLV